MEYTDPGVQRMQFNTAEAEWETAVAKGRFSVILRPRLFIDGNRWCALYGENLQKGVAGFGKTPALAFQDFDKAFDTPLPKT